MTKQSVKRMIKAAKKRSALDSAMEFAERTGKPTSTGIAAGAGLGTILAAIGALNRSGEDQKEQSALSNPLLLGTLGAAGGYLAGNAFERNKPTSSTHNMSLPALLGLVGGTGTIGTLLAHEDNKAELESAKSNFKDLIRRLRIPNFRNDNSGIMTYRLGGRNLPDIDPATGFQRVDRNGRPILRHLTPEEVKEVQDARKGLANAYAAVGDVDAAVRESGLSAKELDSGFLSWLRKGRTSPLSWMKSLNPFKAGDPKLLKAQLGKVIGAHPRATGLAALALLAGGGKAVYDYTKD